MNKINNEVAIVVPAVNEANVISKTLEALLNLVSQEHIYVVDDGSEDDTYKITKKYITNILQTDHRGKANALNSAISYFDLINRYDYIFFMDADTRPSHDFLHHALKHFKKDFKKEIICVIGRVKVWGNNWISMYRQWEYQLSFLIHKRAQEHLNSIIVTPGCATVYRSSVFEKMKFPNGTMTEDMDFTFQLHRAKLNKMVFEKNAVVYTLDPQTIRDFVKQLVRWYTGFWQVVKKHDIPWRGQMLDLEVAILATEGLYNGILILVLAIALFNLIFFGGLGILFLPLILDFILFFLPSLIWTCFSDRNFTKLLYIPHFYFLRFLSSAIFLKAFFNGFVSDEKEYTWNSNRFFGKEVS